jgi:hypothetical protein
MKNILTKNITRTAIAGAIIFSSISHAGLINRGNGLIYDDVLDITWMQNADYLRTSGLDVDGYVDYAYASSWADSLDFGGYDDWRLANHDPLNGLSYDFGFSFDGSTDRGFNDFSQTSELSYMFHHNLSNTSYFDTSGNGMQAGSESFNSSFLDAETGDLFSFQNISISYWSDPVDNPITNAAWGFNFRVLAGAGGYATGENQLLSTTAELAVWAVRDGDVFVDIPDIVPPVAASAPSAIAMLFFGLAGTLAVRRQNRS